MTLRGLTIASAVAASLGLGGQALAQQRAQDINPSPMPPGSRAGESPRMQGGTAPSNAPGTRAQEVNPTNMPPGSRADQAPGMNPAGQAAQQGATPGATGTATPRAQGSPQMMGTGQGTSAGAMQQPVPGASTAQGPNTPDRGVPGGTGAQAPSAQPDVDRGTAPRPGQAQTGQPRDAGTAMPRTTPGTTQGTTQGTGATTPGARTEGGGAREGALVPGANSFTEGQARSRISDAGFNDVQDLRLDEQGIWRGRAMRGGQQTGVALDFQGNVVATPR